MYAITGITGKVGGAAANTLLAQHLPIKAVIRNPAKAIEWQNRVAATAIAELHDAGALTQAFTNTQGVFIMTPPLFDAQNPMAEHDQMLAALCTAIEKARPKKVVYLSSIGAQHAAGTGAIKKLYDMEQSFNKLSVPTIGIRAAWFMENFVGSIPSAQSSGRLLSFLAPTTAAIPMIAATDIGKLAAQLLQTNWTGHQVIELEGPCRYSADDVATVLSYRLNQNITARAIADSDYEAVYQSFGFTAGAAQLMAEMIRGFNNKHIVFEGGAVAHAEGDTLLEDVIASHI